MGGDAFDNIFKICLCICEYAEAPPRVPDAGYEQSFDGQDTGAYLNKYKGGIPQKII